MNILQRSTESRATKRSQCWSTPAKASFRSRREDLVRPLRPRAAPPAFARARDRDREVDRMGQIGKRAAHRRFRVVFRRTHHFGQEPPLSAEPGRAIIILPTNKLRVVIALAPRL